jgi:hypothetical protein
MSKNRSEKFAYFSPNSLEISATSGPKKPSLAPTHLIVLRHDLLQNDVDLAAQMAVLPNITDLQLTTTERVECLLDTACCAIDL